MSKRTFYPYVKDKLDLGLLGRSRLSTTILCVQGVLLGNFEHKGRNFEAIGLKDKDKERKIVLVEWMIDEEIAAYSTVKISRTVKSKSSSTSSTYSFEKFDSKSKLISFLENKLNDLIIFNFGDYEDTIMNKLISKNASDGIKEFYLKYIIPSKDINLDFVSGLLISSKEEIKKFCDDEIFSMSFSETRNEIDGVSNYSDILTCMEKDMFELPIMYGINYR